MKKFKKIRKEYQKLSLLLINTIRKRQIFYHMAKIGKNLSQTTNILYVPNNTEEIRHSYKSKYNLTRENQVILLMITDGEKWHYLAVKSLSALFREITGNSHGYFYCLNCFQSYTTENKLKKHKKICENHDYCYVEMDEGYNKILKCNQGEKSMKVPFIIYDDLKCLLEKTNTCHNNPEKFSTTKINKHTPCGYSLFTHCSFDTTKSKPDFYRGKNCMENFCLHLREHATKIINYEKKEVIPLTKKEDKKHNKQEVCHICKKRFSTINNKKNIIRLEIIVTILETIEVLLMISAT